MALIEPYHQLLESGALTEEAISASLTQDETSELEYRTGVAELRDKLRAFPLLGVRLQLPLCSLPILVRCSMHRPLFHLLYLSLKLPN